MKKVLNIIKSIFTWLIVVLAVCMMIFTIVSVNTFDRNDRSIFGYKAFIVRSDSMSKTDFNSGDVILSKEVDDPSTLKVGDIITFQSTNTDSYGKVVTHKIRELTEDAEGHPGFITYGTTTDANDEKIVTYDFVLGQYKMRLPGLGYFFQFLKTTPGYIVCIFLPFLILILIQGVNSIRLFRRYKKEQQHALQAERDKIEAELQAKRDKIEADQAETQRMMEKMQQMMAKMENSGEKSESAADSADEQSSENS